MPLLQTILVSQHGTQLSSNMRIFLVAKIENHVTTSHFCALIDYHLLYFVQDTKFSGFWLAGNTVVQLARLNTSTVIS